MFNLQVKLIQLMVTAVGMDAYVFCWVVRHVRESSLILLQHVELMYDHTLPTIKACLERTGSQSSFHGLLLTNSFITR